MRVKLSKGLLIYFNLSDPKGTRSPSDRSYNPELEIKKLLRKIHLYIGAVSGLIVFVEALTGALWVFKEEITAWTDEQIVVTVKDTPVINPTTARTKAEEAVPGRAIHGVLYPMQDGRPIEMIFYESDPEFYYSLFLDPYSGAAIGHVNHRHGFFAFVLDGHLHLWLSPDVGKPIISYGTLLFLLSIVSGMVLWWPKNRKSSKQRFRFDWKETTRWRRKNFDLHAVVGFYVAIFAFIFGVTGLVMALNWFSFMYYRGLGGDKEMAFIIPSNTSERVEMLGDMPAIDQLPKVLKEKFPTARDFEIHYPYADSVSIYVEVSYTDLVYYDSDYVFFDQRTLKEVSTPSIYGKFEEASATDHLMRSNYDIHVGAIGGLPTKILAFLGSLIVASLPVTGGLLWLGRRHKKRKTVPVDA